MNVGAFPPHWAGATITWGLTETPKGTRAASRAGLPDGEAGIPMISETWGILMTRLKDFAETGEPRPYFSV
ncbi:hypothetical protein [Streptomyces sp. NPDC013457]|uniref:hypothetical protein n=1 Tax=Streptomyces sp. NPDC013457 TaxID=3364866 RepID=UPI00370160BD